MVHVSEIMYIKDICSAIKSSIKYLNKKSDILNIGNGEGVSNKDVILNLNNYFDTNFNKLFKKEKR